MTAEFKKEHRNRIDSIMEEAVHQAFEKIEDYRAKEDLAPTDIMGDLAIGWDLGDYWADWWLQADDGEWE